MLYYCDKCHNNSKYKLQRMNYKDKTIHVKFECSVCGDSETKVYDLKGNKIVNYKGSEKYED